MRASAVRDSVVISQLPRVPQDETLIISTLPRERLGDEELGLLITSGLLQRLEARCTVPKDCRLNTAQYRILDDLIIEQTHTLGELALASPLVRERLHAWRDHPHGIGLTERFASALVKAVRYHKRMEPPPLDSRLRQSKKETVEELRSAFRILRKGTVGSLKNLSSRELIERFRHVIVEGNFRYLSGFSDAWSDFFAQQPGFVSNALAAPRFAPATVFDAWLAWATGYEQEYLRQKISTLKS